MKLKNKRSAFNWQSEGSQANATSSTQLKMAKLEVCSQVNQRILIPKYHKILEILTFVLIRNKLMKK